ncbi:hypothetical protein [Amycolatopsis thailandensis]|uniref:hypothetical protein n=1 Tax=Amycolatopsis thailandensis TaxID=589330 RepID=UPI00117857F9|nr:hypothetical protein [Amycolatopsis thailandensis]
MNQHEPDPVHVACAVVDDAVPADAGAAKTLPIPSTRIVKMVAIRRVFVIMVSLSGGGRIPADRERPEVETNFPEVTEPIT